MLTDTQQDILVKIFNKHNNNLIRYINTNILLTKKVMKKDIKSLVYVIDLKRMNIKFVGDINHLNKINVVIKNNDTIKPIFDEISKNKINLNSLRQNTLSIKII